MVGGVGEVLGLEAEACAVFAHASRLSVNRAVEKVSAIELDARLVREDFEHAAGRRLVHRYIQTNGSVRAVQHPVVIVTFSESQLLVGLVDTSADCNGLTEVKRRAGHWTELSGRDQRHF